MCPLRLPLVRGAGEQSEPEGIVLRAAVPVHKNSLRAQRIFREETYLYVLTYELSRSFHQTISRKGAANWVAQRKMAILLAHNSK